MSEKNRKSPLAPSQTQAISKPGAYPQGLGQTRQSENTTPVIKGSSKNSLAEPSLGTATHRTPDLERNGAQYRVRHDVFTGVAPANEPYSAANGANTPVVQDAQTPAADKNYAAGTNGMVSRHFAMHRDGRGALGVR